MPVDLALSVYQSSVKTGELLSLLIHTAREVRRLKDECEAVRKHAAVVKAVLDNNQQILQNDECERNLQGVLRQLLQFVIWCKSSNILQRVWEVTWTKRLPRLMQELMTWTLILSAGTTVSARSDLSGLVANVYQSEQLRRKDTTEVTKQLQSQATILDQMMKVVKGEDAPKLQIDFRDNDPRLIMDPASPGNALVSGKLFRHDSQSDSVKVICEPVNESLMSYGETGPRHVLIYTQISANAGVQPFYGIAERDGKRWTVMKDLRSMPTLANAIQNGTWPEPHSHRLSVAYEVAKTMEYLHSVEILVKRLSDSTVVMEEIDGTITPYVTDLESARLFKERTTGQKYDIRYEAPEILTIAKKQHNIYTDIWSLGIFIWECATGSPPFGIAAEVLDGSDPDATVIRKRTSDYDILWTHNNQDLASLQAVSRLVKQCCNRRSTIRPSATEVVHTLLEIMTTQKADSNENLSFDGEITKETIAKILESKDKTAKLSEKDKSNLRVLVDNGDATAAYLRGSAIWNKYLEPDDEVQSGFIIVSEQHRETEMRARAALPLLELAFQTGIKQAAEDLGKIYEWLGRLHQTKYNRAKTLKSL